MSVAPKPENDVDGTLLANSVPHRPESCDTALAYPVQNSSRSFLQTTSYPITLKFEEIVYKVYYERKRSCGGTSTSTKEKTILNGITGMVSPGEILAMLGPSGSGKTTLLTALGGRLSGRLPKSLSKDEKAQHVENVIVELGLTRRAHSGLDSTTAQRILNTVKGLASGGRTIITTIHQPSSRLYHMFDKVVLLSEGCPIYYGLASAALEYFSSIGFSTSVAVNPADLLLDLANGIGPDFQHANDHNDNVQQDPVSVREFLISAYDKNISTGLKSELCSADVNYTKESSTNCDVVLLLSVLGLLPTLQCCFYFSPRKKHANQGKVIRHVPPLVLLSSQNGGRSSLELALPTAFTFIFYWMGGLKPDPATFILSLLVVLFSVLVSQSLGLAFGALLMDVKQAATLASVTTMVFLIAGGYYVRHIPPFIAWLRYLSYSYYCYRLLLGIQYDENDYYECAKGAYCRVADYPPIKSVGLSNCG
ncbi:UNVERIFIED_CONTAM: ABC transporter G family member 14 [Sesamum calycinum]|uniref:ABC transporter G family member 14 n=1 Tax=Sesamum calycinum TaxID=2727403 RepID=A0AAW2J2J8_9LAMI